MLKQIFSRWFGKPVARQASVPDDSGFFATRFADRHEETRLFVPWADRAPDLGTRPYDSALGMLSLVKLLSQDRALSSMGAEQLSILGGYFEYAQIAPGKQVIGQGEQGDFLMLVLDGSLAEERRMPSGKQVRVGELRQGDVLGEMSLLDDEARGSSCIALSPVILAVLPMEARDRMMQDEPRLAAACLAWVAKRLALRLRQMTARLSMQLSRPAAD
jgi:CRP/FNR family transcriptional regulator, cyclic AMP receptor protein